MMKFKSLVGLILIHILAPASAQNYIGLREVINYEKRIYNAGSQNWDIRQDVQGRVYFANNEGLLCFDGTYWKLYPLPNKTIVRSLEIGKDNRIYVGGQDEIGFFSPGKNGKLVYESLKHLLPESDQKFADVWEIVALGNDLFFRCNNRIFRYSGNKMSVYTAPLAFLFMGLHQDSIIAQDISRGLLIFRNNQWETLIEKKLLPTEAGIGSVLKLNSDSSLLIFNNEGMYVLGGKQLTPFQLKGLPIPSMQFSVSIPIDQQQFMVGSYNNGFYLINKNGTVVENFSRKDGLQNSSVRSLYQDKNGNIWAGLDNGIDLIAFNNAIKHINPPIMNDGGGYSVMKHADHLLFAVSNGIYRLPLADIKDLSYSKDNFSVLSGGQTWSLLEFDGKAFAGKDEGFFKLENNSLQPIVRGNGYWTLQPVQQPDGSTIVAAGNYHGVKLFSVEQDNLVPQGGVPHFNESSRFLVVDKSNMIWVSHPYRGVYKIQLNTARDSMVKLYNQNNGLPSSLNNHVYKIKNRIVIATEKGIYEYNSTSDSFEASAYFKDIFGTQGVRYMKEDPTGNIWFVQEKNVGVIDFSDLNPSLIYLPELKGKILSGFENIYPVDDHNIFVGGEKGFYHINYDKYKQNNHALQVYIRTVKLMGKTDSLVFGGYFGDVNENRFQAESDIPQVSHKWNSLHIEYASPLFEQQSNVEYSYLLEGFDKDWSEWSSKTEKDYTNLAAGSYTFKVKSRNNLKSESAPASYSFKVFPPWYQTIAAYILYVLMLIALIIMIYYRQRKKLLKERQKHQEEQKRQAYLHQLELEKSEKELVKLKNEKLESEIEFKNSELASTAMHLVQKEAFLSKIKDELQHLNKSVKEDRTDTAEVKKILRIMSEEEKLNEEWEQFSVHFDKVHGDFLLLLKEKYPSLKAHELKLCAYLRMNLSSKEIAQLMSISVRGVEISRYRLRKKLQIPTDANLFQFLLDIHLSKKQTEPGT